MFSCSDREKGRVAYVVYTPSCFQTLESRKAVRLHAAMFAAEHYEEVREISIDQACENEGLGWDARQLLENIFTDTVRNREESALVLAGEIVTDFVQSALEIAVLNDVVVIDFSTPDSDLEAELDYCNPNSGVGE